MSERHVPIGRKESLETPILFVVFNRPGVTGRVFDSIRQVRPKQLFVIADGARRDRDGEELLCQQTRDIATAVDWECKLECLFHEKNQGCKLAVSSGINWFFEHVDKGIILEDDCLPDKSFFWFCEELLGEYADDERVMQISGSNYLFGRKNVTDSYYFSRLNDVWGWATWKRAWDHFDLAMPNFDRYRSENQLVNFISDEGLRRWLMSYFEEALSEGASVWSTQWQYAIARQNGLVAVPGVNLVDNLGFGKDSTHGEDDSWSLYSEAKVEPLGEIRHPPFVLPDIEADKLRFDAIRKTDPREIARRKTLRASLFDKVIGLKKKSRDL